MDEVKAAFRRTAWAAWLFLWWVDWRAAAVFTAVGSLLAGIELVFALRQERRERKVRHAIREQLKAKLAEPPRVRPSPLPVTHRIGPVEYAEADEDDMRRINNYRWN